MSRLGGILNQILTDLKRAKRKKDKRALDDAFYELQQTSFDALRWSVFAIVHNAKDADSIVLDTYTRAYLYVDSFNTLSDGYNWLLQIAKRQAYDFLQKSHYKNNVPLQDVDYALAERSFAMDNFIDLIDLRRARKSLSVIDNKIIDCCFFKGYTFEQTSQIVGLSKSSVHERLSKILNELQKKLKKDRTK